MHSVNIALCSNKMLKEGCLDSLFSDIDSVDQDLHFLLGQISGLLVY